MYVQKLILLKTLPSDRLNTNTYETYEHLKGLRILNILGHSGAAFKEALNKSIYGT